MLAEFLRMETKDQYGMLVVGLIFLTLHIDKKIQRIFTFLRAYFPKISRNCLWLKGFKDITPKTEQGITGNNRE